MNGMVDNSETSEHSTSLSFTVKIHKVIKNLLCPKVYTVILFMNTAKI